MKQGQKPASSGIQGHKSNNKLLKSFKEKRSSWHRMGNELQKHEMNGETSQEATAGKPERNNPGLNQGIGKVYFGCKLEKKIMAEHGEEWEDFTHRHMP